MIYSKEYLADIAYRFERLLRESNIERIEDIVKKPVRVLDSGKGYSVRMATRLFDYNGESCYHLSYQTSHSISHWSASPFIVEINNSSARVTIECDTTIRGYTEWLRTKRGGIVQRKELKALKNREIMDNIMKEFGRLGRYK